MVLYFVYCFAVKRRLLCIIVLLLRVTFFQTINPKELDLHENTFVICVNGVSKGIFNGKSRVFRA